MHPCGALLVLQWVHDIGQALDQGVVVIDRHGRSFSVGLHATLASTTDKLCQWHCNSARVLYKLATITRVVASGQCVLRDLSPPTSTAADLKI